MRLGGLNSKQIQILQIFTFLNQRGHRDHRGIFLNHEVREEHEDFYSLLCVLGEAFFLCEHQRKLSPSKIGHLYDLLLSRLNLNWLIVGASFGKSFLYLFIFQICFF